MMVKKKYNGERIYFSKTNEILGSCGEESPVAVSWPDLHSSLTKLWCDRRVMRLGVRRPGTPPHLATCQL